MDPDEIQVTTVTYAVKQGEHLLYKEACTTSTSCQECDSVVGLNFLPPPESEVRLSANAGLSVSIVDLQ